MLLTEKTSCVSASMLMVLRFNCTTNRCNWLKYEISETDLSGAAYDSHADMFGNTAGEEHDKTDVERVAHARPAPGPRRHRADLSSGTQILRAGSVAWNLGAPDLPYGCSRTRGLPV